MFYGHFQEVKDEMPFRCSPIWIYIQALDLVDVCGQSHCHLGPENTPHN